MFLIRRSHRYLTAILTIILIASQTMTASGQTKEAIDQNLTALNAVRGSLEGYAATIEGQIIQYPRIRSDVPQAILTRTTTGAMAVVWETVPVPSSGDARGYSFVVRAGIQAQPGVRRNFEVSINDVPRFVITTTEQGAWTVQGKDGGSIAFTSIMRDQFNDTFGYMRFNLPSAWVTPGSPVRIRIVGEKAGIPTWLMVYQDSANVSFLQGKADHESYCDFSIVADGRKVNVTARGSSNLVGKPLEFETSTGEKDDTEFSLEEGHAIASFSYSKSDGLPASFLVDRQRLLLPKDLGADSTISRMLVSNVVTLRTQRVAPDKWKVEYMSTYTPALGASLVELTQSSQGTGELYLVSSSHQDVAWMDTPQQCEIDRDEKVITPALELLEKEPDFCYDLEDMLEVREYITRHPDRKARLTRFFKEGRLAVGATYIMPYEDMQSSEALVRQLYAGRKWFRKNFPGCDTRIVWNPDVPGRTLQSAQVMKKGGVDYLIISRHAKGFFDWTSPDGSAIRAFSPGHYGLFQERTLGKPFHEASSFVASSAVEWRDEVLPGSPSIPLFSMSDMSAPMSYKSMMETWNSLRSIEKGDGTAQPLALPTLRYATAEQYMAAASKDGKLQPSVNGERPNIWLYIHGPTHHWAVTAKREADVLLPAAESFSTVEALLSGSFSSYPQSKLTEAWEAIVYPDHGWGGKGGEVTDSLFRAKYETACNIGKDVHGQAIQAIAGRVKAQANKGIPLMVFNGLSWKRNGAVQATLSFEQGKFPTGFTLKDARGKSVPYQVVRREDHPGGSIRNVDIVFVANGIPAVGYATYYVAPASSAARPATVSRPAPASLENRFYALTLKGGGVAQIHDKELRRDLLQTDKFLGGELFTMQSIGEDAGEWAEPQYPDMEGFERVADNPGAWTLVEYGPVRQVIESRHKTVHATVVSRVLLYAALKQVEFETSLLQWDGARYREFRLAFPVNMKEGQIAYEVPFGTLEVGKDEMKGAAGERYIQEVAKVRPRSIMNWINIADASFGVTLGSSVAVWDYVDPTANPISSPMLQPILLASRRSCHGAGPWYLQVGDHHYRFALTSHRPGEGRQFGAAANAPLTAVFAPAGQKARTLPESRSFFDTGSEQVVLSTMKKAEDDNGVIVRLYEADGTNAVSSMTLPFTPARMERTNIIEEEGREFDLPAAQGGKVMLEMPHHSIETVKFLPGGVQ